MAKIHEQIIKIMAEADFIPKGRKSNDREGYMFRGIDDIYASMQPLLAKHGVFTAINVTDSKIIERVSKSGSAVFTSILTVRYDVFADDGSMIQLTVIGEGKDSGDKATNKAMSVAHKYAFLQLFAIPTVEPKDPENDGHDIEGIYKIPFGPYEGNTFAEVEPAALYEYVMGIYKAEAAHKDKDPAATKLMAEYKKFKGNS